MRRRHIFSIDFAYVQILNGLSMCLSFFVIKIFIDSIACDYAIVKKNIYICIYTKLFIIIPILFLFLP